MTSSSGVTSARDQSLESSQSGWSTKFCKLFSRVTEKLHRQIFVGKKNCPKKIGQRPLRVTSTRIKKLELCCDVKRKQIFAEICRR